MTLRSCAAALIFSPSGQILTGKRSDSKSTQVGKWQFPQGGVQPGEDKLAAVYREITEEIGLLPKHLELVYTLPEPLVYIFPAYKINKKHEGQTVQWFVFFMRNPDLGQCYLNNEDPPEFVDVKWSDWDSLLSETVVFKENMFRSLRSLTDPIIAQYLHNLQAS